MPFNFRAYLWLVRDSKHTSSEKLVATILAAHADEQGWAWPGAVRLAEASGLSERTVRAALGRLVASGELLVSRRTEGRTTNTYVLHNPAAIAGRPATTPAKSNIHTFSGRDQKITRTREEEEAEVRMLFMLATGGEFGPKLEADAYDASIPREELLESLREAHRKLLQRRSPRPGTSSGRATPSVAQAHSSGRISP